MAKLPPRKAGRGAAGQSEAAQRTCHLRARRRAGSDKGPEKPKENPPAAASGSGAGLCPALSVAALAPRYKHRLGLLGPFEGSWTGYAFGAAHGSTGEIPISGAKNAALKLMAASLLTAEPLILANVPRLADVRAMAELLSSFGVDVEVAQCRSARRGRHDLLAGGEDHVRRSPPTTWCARCARASRCWRRFWPARRGQSVTARRLRNRRAAGRICISLALDADGRQGGADGRLCRGHAPRRAEGRATSYFLPSRWARPKPR